MKRQPDLASSVLGWLPLKLSKFLPPPPFMLTPSIIISSASFLLRHSLWAALLFCCPLLTAPITCNPDMSSGLLGWECLLSTPSLLPGVHNLHLSKLFSHSFCITSFPRNLDTPSGLLLWQCLLLLLCSYGSSYPCCRLLWACLTLFLVTALCMLF